MITYTARDLVKRARQLADLENSDFISWNEQINLLNENYVALYQKLCNVGDGAFVTTIHVDNGETELPADFYQLKSVSLYNNGNVIPVLRRSATQSYNDRYYELKNGNIYIGGYSGDYVIEYFPEPQTLTFKPESVKIEESVVTKNTVVAAYDKVLLLDNRNVYNLETQSIIATFPDASNFYDASAVIVMDDQFIVTQYAYLNYKTGESRYNNGGAWYDSAFTVIIDGKIYVGKYDSDEGLVYYYSSRTDYSQGRESGSFEYECDTTAYTPSRFLFTDKDFSDFWEITTINGTATLLHNGEEVDFSFPFNQIVVKNGILYSVTPKSISYSVKYITADNEIGAINVDGEAYAINKFDYDTGFGFTVKRNNYYYIDSFLEDTVLDFPNTFYYNILSYYLAIAFKLKQGGDITGLSAMLAQQEQTFFDTLSNDDCGPVRISNVY